MRILGEEPATKSLTVRDVRLNFYARFSLQTTSSYEGPR